MHGFVAYTRHAFLILCRGGLQIYTFYLKFLINFCIIHFIM